MINYHSMDIPENIEYINNIYYLYSREQYIFQPYENKVISIYLVFNIKRDNFIYFNVDNRLQSIFNLDKYIFTDPNNKFTVSLEIYNKTNKTIIINKNEKFIQFYSDYLTNDDKYYTRINKEKNKNINDLIFENVIELKNNSIIFFNKT